jgi:hypothetical protein
MEHEVYCLIVKGHLGGEWSEWFDGLTITRAANGETHLIGPVADQTALHGVLLKIRDLGLPLLSLTRIEPDLFASCAGPCPRVSPNVGGVEP